MRLNAADLRCCDIQALLGQLSIIMARHCSLSLIILSTCLVLSDFRQLLAPTLANLCSAHVASSSFLR